MKTILVATIGTTPAVLTETVWALAVNGKMCIGESIIPDKVVTFTYEKCVDAFCRVIFEKDGNATSGWERLKENLQKRKIKIKDKLKFGKASIFPYKNDDAFVQDAFSEGAMDAIANTFVREIKSLRDNSNEPIRIIASISGGRKTDGALLMSCMGLLGQNGDKVIHLIPRLGTQDDFDVLKKARPLFLFPEDGEVYSCQKTAFSNDGIDEFCFKAEEVKLNLFEVPLLMTGKWYKASKNYNRIISYSTLVDEQMRQMETSCFPKKVEIDFENGFIVVDGKPVKNNTKPIRPIEFFVLVYNTIRQKEATPNDFKSFIGKIQKKKTLALNKFNYHWINELSKDKGPFRGSKTGKSNQDLARICGDIKKHCAGIVKEGGLYIKKDLISKFEESKKKFEYFQDLVEFKIDP